MKVSDDTRLELLLEAVALEELGKALTAIGRRTWRIVLEQTVAD